MGCAASSNTHKSREQPEEKEVQVLKYDADALEEFEANLKLKELIQENKEAEGLMLQKDLELQEHEAQQQQEREWSEHERCAAAEKEQLLKEIGDSGTQGTNVLKLS